MKTILKNLFIWLLPLLFLTSCLRNDEPKDTVRVMNVTVAHYTEMVAIEPFFLEDNKQERLVIFLPDGIKRHVHEIEGFEYEHGFEYKLQIQEITLAEPLADGGWGRHVLIKVLSKEKKE